jgi:hypothetical protein
VIKGRLENGMTDPDAPTPHLFEMGDPPPEPQAQPVLVGAPGRPDSALERAQAAIASLAPMAAVAPPGRARHRTAQGAAGPTAFDENKAPASEAPEPQAAVVHDKAKESDDSRRVNSRRPIAEHEEPAAGGTGSSRRRRGAASRPERETESQPAAAEVTEPGVGDTESVEAAVPPRRVSTRSTAGLPGSAMSGASLSLVELAGASGLDIAGVEELQSFGLIAGRTVAGVPCYGEEAVLVAKLAARFAPFGIEARHLKAFKHAADRQTGLFSQVVTPLLRQRNPEARARAIADLNELAELGEALMRCFSQATLRELTGG